MTTYMIPWEDGEVEINPSFGAALKLERTLGVSIVQTVGLINEGGVTGMHWIKFLSQALKETDLKPKPSELDELLENHYGVLVISLTAWYLACVEPQLAKMTAAASSVMASDT